VNIKKELGKNIKKYRKLKKLTQKEMSKQICMDPGNLSSIERGKYFPNSDNLVKISQVLKVDVYKLFLFENK